MSVSRLKRKGYKTYGLKRLDARNHLTAIRKFRKRLVDQSTYPERKFRRALDQTEIPYEFQKIIRTGNHYRIVDFFLFNSDIAIEIDGAHHYTRQGLYKDNKRTNDLKATYRVDNVVRFSNKFVLTHSDDELIKILKGLIYPTLPSRPLANNKQDNVYDIRITRKRPALEWGRLIQPSRTELIKPLIDRLEG